MSELGTETFIIYSTNIHPERENILNKQNINLLSNTIFLCEMTENQQVMHYLNSYEKLQR